MSELQTQNVRDERTGRFLAGNGGNGGRKPGSRNKLAEQFLLKFAADVELHGTSVIERVRTERPEVYLKVWADLLPAKTELNISVDILQDVTSTLEAYRTMAALVGADPASGLRRLKQLAPEIIDVEPS